MKKHTYEFVKKQFEKEGYVLLSEEYKNSKIKLRYICNNGHIGCVSFAKWVIGTRCKRCFFNSISINGEMVEAELKALGLILVSDKSSILNKKSLFTYRCGFGHEVEVKWDSFRQSRGCKICNLKKRDDNLRLQYKYVKKSFENEGYTLISDVYINAFAKLYYICPKGHRHFIKWNDWKTGYRCPTCANIGNSIRFTGSGHPNWKGGASCEPYCDVWKDKEFKQDIKERDDYVCQNPDCWGTSDKLVIHHIDYNKKNCHPNNLITLCVSCNARANKNREWHQEFYKNLIKK